MTGRSPINLELTHEDVGAAIAGLMGGQPSIQLDPDKVQHDLARVVLALIEFLRRLLELQAIRRMEKGMLTIEEEETVGLTLMRAKEQLRSLAFEFGIEEDQLNLDLGPLGKLM